MSRVDPLLEKYFAEADGWDREVVALRARSERNAWRLTWASAAVTVLSIAALALLLPLKRVEPYVVRVDASTGIVDVVPRLEATQSVDEVVARYLLSQYVRICEQFYLPSAISDYETCGAFNSSARNQEWYQRWTPSNPQSPLQLYKDGTTIRAQVTSVTFLNAAVATPIAQVRYQLGRRAAGTGLEVVTYWIATIQYEFAAPSRDARVRQTNPMGLRVLDFRREAEVPSTLTTTQRTRAGSTPSEAHP